MMDALTFDARPYQCEGKEPFAYIMKALEQRTEGQPFVVINTFDPRPLEAVMEARGFVHAVDNRGPEHFVVTFTESAERRRGDRPIIDRRGVPLDTAMFQLNGILRRLRPGETFQVRLDAEPSPALLNVPKTAGAMVDVHANPKEPGAILTVTRRRPEPSPSAPRKTTS